MNSTSARLKYQQQPSFGTENGRGGDLSVHSASNTYDSSKYQKSYPTPKNTTPLGYHTRKKQVIKEHPSPSRSSFRRGDEFPPLEKEAAALIILGGSDDDDDNNNNHFEHNINDGGDEDSRPQTRIKVTYKQQDQYLSGKQRISNEGLIGEGLEASDTIVR